MTNFSGVRLGAALLASVSTAAFGQVPESEASPTAGSESEEESIETAEHIVVQANIGYRNRTETAEPILEYGTDYFQRFEPLTIGDALKRVPSVAFLSDVIESDGARLRGLDPGYTQILINGDRIPGSQADRSFFLDRIPAELVDRVEIVRSSSARRTADAVAGTLNIVLRDGYELDGGYVKGAGMLFDDGKVRFGGAGVWGGPVGPGRLLLGANIQQRYNPKKKESLRYDELPENNSAYTTENFVNREDQDDIRDGTDYNFNGSYGVEFGDTKVDFNGYYVHTDRTEDERSFEYDHPTAESGPKPTGALLTDNANVARIDQDSYNFGAKVSHKWSLGKTTARVTYARFLEDREETEFEIDFDRSTPRFTGDLTLTDIDDREFALSLEHAFPIAQDIDFAIGTFWQDKDRDTDIGSVRNRFNLTNADRIYDQFNDNPTRFNTSFSETEPEPGGLNTIEERRLDFFGLVEGRTGIAKWEIGARYETTDVDIDDLESDQRFKNHYGIFLPSASVKLDVTSRDRITASVARTNKRPRFDFLSPALLEAELGDNDQLGNPDLKPETAWGADIGYERKIGATGVAGVNLFYRKVSDLVEFVNTGLPGAEDDDETPEIEAFVLQPQNMGSGKAWGIEFDLSTSLAFVGLPDTGIFGNLALLDSETRDVFGKRRFNGQPKYVYNLGFIQNLPSWGAAFGATFRKQGQAKDRLVGEEVITTYGGDLEIFVEKRFWNKLTIRATGSNLLNGSKDEAFRKWASIEDQLDRGPGTVDEYELESEEAGPVFQLVARLAF